MLHDFCQDPANMRVGICAERSYHTCSLSAIRPARPRKAVCKRASGPSNADGTDRAESTDLPKSNPEDLSATTIDGGETLTETASLGGAGVLAVPLSGVVLPEGLDIQEQRKRLWFAAVKPPMYTVALIPILVSCTSIILICL